VENNQRDWLHKARDLAPIVEAHSDEAERERRLPQPVFEAMRNAGFFRMWMPKAYGGYETGIETLLAVGEEVSRHDASAAWNLIIGVIGNFMLAYLPESTAREMLAADPDLYIAGAGNPGSARATAAEGGHIVSGTWPLASGCHQANWLFGGSFVFEGDKPILGPNGRPEHFIFLFPRAQAEILDTWHPLGLHGTGSHHIKADDIFVPDDRRLSVTASPPIQSGPLYRGPILDGLGTLPVVSLGIARSAIDSFVELAAAKTPTQGRTKLAELHTTQERVGRAEDDAGSRSRLYVRSRAGDRRRPRIGATNPCRACDQAAPRERQRGGSRDDHRGLPAHNRRHVDHRR
jgi:alkylation response protein AidB-like acyl-CoA dehydrogenase